VVERAKRIADTFENTPHAPADPQVKAAYEAMIRETLAQYQFIKQSGLKVEPIEPGMADPYAQSPWHAILDVRENNHLWFFPTESGFGSDGAFTADTHPLLAPTGEYIGGRQLLANDVFRIVHDYFGHVKDGVGFRADGEENAWRSHSAMYSPLARRAMTAETRGQNSWVNYGPYGEANRGASGGETKYANQKALLLPEEFSVVDDAGVVAKPAAAPADAAATPAKPTDASEAQADPDVLAARQLVEQSDLEIPTGELDADGQPIVTSAREQLAAADAEVARAESDGKGYEAAISCLLSFGGGT
jgi:hypothetical protein